MTSLLGACGAATDGEGIDSAAEVATDVEDPADAELDAGVREPDAAAPPHADAGGGASTARPTTTTSVTANDERGPDGTAGPREPEPAASPGEASEPGSAGIPPVPTDVGPSAQELTPDAGAPSPGESSGAGDAGAPDEGEGPRESDDDYSVEQLMIPGGIACETMSSGFEAGPGNTNFATLYWNAQIHDSGCRLAPGFESDADAPALLRFGEELGLYGPFSIWQGDNGGFGYGSGFESEDPNNVPAGVDLSIIVNVLDPPIVLEVFFRFDDSEVTVQQVVQR